MQVHGREVGFRFTVGASAKISDLCPDGDISRLGEVTRRYRDEFISTYDALFAQWPEDYESYYFLSEDMREEFIRRRRRIPILHRNGGDYLFSPKSGRLEKVDAGAFRKFGRYKENLG